MRCLLILPVLVMLIWVISLGCSDSTTCPELKPPFDEMSQEAKLIALCLSGELRPPYSLTRHVEGDLAAIRTTFGEEYSIVEDISFLPPWLASCIIVGFDEATAQMVRDDQYDAWDALNEEYGLADIDKALLSIGAVVLHFEGVMHPHHLTEIYSQLPGTRYVEPNWYRGDWRNIYPRLAGRNITYLFRDAWGDCPAGCTGQAFWYFTFDGKRPILVGAWEPRHGVSPPNWWEEAALNIALYDEW
jgi:hypothetical protein